MAAAALCPCSIVDSCDPDPCQFGGECMRGAALPGQPLQPVVCTQCPLGSRGVHCQDGNNPCCCFLGWAEAKVYYGVIHRNTVHRCITADRVCSQHCSSLCRG